MLNKLHEKQQGMELIILEQLVPQDHLLRKIDRSIDFSFIRRLCAPLYSANLGRPAIQPEVLFRMLFVGYLYGIQSERRLEEEIHYNMACKWFCGLSLTEKAPDATTLSVNRKRRFRDNDIPERIFNEILRQAMEKKTGGWDDSVYGLDAHQGQGLQTQKDDGRGGANAQSVSGRDGRGHRPGPQGVGQEAL